MNKDFRLFQTTFKKYQQLFGLTGYKIYFKHEALEGAFANITIIQSGMVATARLNKDLNEDTRCLCKVEDNAKHEALHLLVYRLEDVARMRYVREGEIDEAAEELVRKLEQAIPDIKTGGK